jgi:hypothetical protein
MTRGFKKGLIVAATAAVAASGPGFAASGATLHLSAKMDAKQVAPRKPRGNVANATGTFSGTLARSTTWKLSWRLSYRGLDHPTIVIADIHYGKPGKFGPILVRLCGPCKSGQHGVKKVKGIYVPMIRAGNTFITLITGKNPNGEIRGQIKAR